MCPVRRCMWLTGWAMAPPSQGRLSCFAARGSAPIPNTPQRLDPNNRKHHDA